MVNVIGNRKIYLGISTVIVGVAVVAIVLWGFKQGIDFTGGTFWQFKLTGNESVSQVEEFFKNDLGIREVKINTEEESGSLIIKLPDITEDSHQQYANYLKTKFGTFEELSFQSIGPSVGAELKDKSILAVILVLLGISLYIAYAFRRVYQPISSWKYGVVTLISLFHDVVIPAGMLAILGHYGAVEIDGNFVVALLVVVGFSVHDTIVVFDRIRENLLIGRGKKEFGEVINESVNETLARSINTSLTLILVLLALYFFGPVSLQYFVLTLLVGVTVGIYSSIFVASPLLYVWHKLSTK